MPAEQSGSRGSTGTIAPIDSVWWWCRVLDADGTPQRLVVVSSTKHPHLAVVEVTTAQAEAEIDGCGIVEAHYRDGAVDQLIVPGWLVPKAPPLWFLELVGLPSASPSSTTPDDPSSHLMAFPATDGLPAHRLLAPSELGDTQLRSEDQVAAIEWNPRTGEVLQIYVDPARRRQGLATAIGLAAAVLARARNRPDVWSDGQRTELGEKWRQGGFWKDYIGEQTHVLPPMTPGEA